MAEQEQAQLDSMPPYPGPVESALEEALRLEEAIQEILDRMPHDA